MFCPEGFHLISELEEIVLDIVKSKVPFLIPLEATKLAEKGNYDDLNKYIIKHTIQRDSLFARLVDNFLKNIKNIWICSPENKILKFSKNVIIPKEYFYANDEEYLYSRDNDYDVLDINYWIIDSHKQKKVNEMIKNLIPDNNKNVIIFDDCPTDLSKFHGWGLCIKEEDFPKTTKDLLKICNLHKIDSNKSPSGRPSKESEEALRLLKLHFPNGTGNLSSKEIMLKTGGYHFFSLKTLNRVLARDKTK